MTYPAYSEYKDSGVGWLGKVPVSWDICRIKNTATLNPSKKEVRSLSNDTVVSFIPMEVIGEQGELNLAQTKNISDVMDGYTYVAEGDVIIAKITPCFENGKGAIANNLTNGIGFATTEVIPIRPNLKSDATFLYYLLKSDPFKSIAEGSMYGAGGQKRVSDNFVAEYHCAYPSVNEREVIATFLDRETQKIDRLIEKQQQLIKLLQEKRQAVISHAVTKGLNPNAKMKDSGVEWLGEIPEHWEVWKLSHFSPIITCGVAATPEYVDEGVVFLSAQNVKNGKIDLKKGFKYITKDKHAELTKYRVPTNGDILLSRVGTVGEACIVDVDFEFSIFVSLTHLRLNNNVCMNEYFIFLCATRYMKSLHSAVTLVGGGVGNLNVNDLREYHLPIPPLEEQTQLVDDLSIEILKIDKLIDKAGYAIKLMKERRTALISAAVTGKIDVRNIVMDNADETTNKQDAITV